MIVVIFLRQKISKNHQIERRELSHGPVVEKGQFRNFKLTITGVMALSHVDIRKF